MAPKSQQSQQPTPVDPDAIVEIVLRVPLRCFGDGEPLKPTGNILAGHWINIDRYAPVQCEVRGLRDDVDVIAGFNTTSGKVTLRHITERKAKAERPQRAASTFVPAKRSFI